MAQSVGSRIPRFIARLAALTGCVLAVSYCGEQGRFGPGPVGPGGDTESPVAIVTVAGSAADTSVVDITDSLQFTVRVTDNVRVATVSVRLTGIGTFVLDTTVLDTTLAAAATDVSRSFTVPLAAASAGQRISVAATGTDATGNTATRTVVVVVEDPQPPAITVREPSSGITVPAGGILSVIGRATDPSGIRQLGARLFNRNALGQPVAIAGDSQTYGGPLPTARTDTFLVTVPFSLRPGSYPVHIFGVDGSTGVNDTTSADITINVADTLSPFGTFSLPLANAAIVAGDSVLVTFRARDSTGVRSVSLRGISARGNVGLGTDTTVLRFRPKSLTFASLPRDSTVSRYLNAVATDSTSETVQLEATITDVGGNTAVVTTPIRIVSGPIVSIVRPTAGSFTSAGRSVPIEVTGVDPQGVRILGWRTSGVVTAQDSIIATPVLGALARSRTFIDTLVIPGGTPVGSIVITPFGVDSLGDPSGFIAGVTVTVQSVTGDVTPPAVTFTVDTRVEVDDSISVRATDASGITWVGFVARQLGSSAIVRADSVLLSGALTDVTQRFQLTLDTISTYPRQVTVEGFARDAVVPTSNRGVSVTGTAANTLTVVAGKTIALPAGGQIADAIYNRNRNELYLSNIALNRLEIFQLNDSTFAPPIPVGSRPWGLALWPRDTLGNNADTVIVANSGGTNLSVVDVGGSRVERRRHRLPNYFLQKVKTAIDPNNSSVVLNITEFDYSDRPQFVGTTCARGGVGGCDSVLAVYSTSPSIDQTTFPNRGYMAWENLMSPVSAPSGHFFYEPAVGSASLATDTLQIIAVRDTAPGFARRDTILGAGYGTMADFNQLVFQDTTYVRNSGDFNHALIGEGGLDQGFARALTFDARPGVSLLTSIPCLTDSLLGTVLNCNAQLDNGVSAGIFIRDFIANRASRITSVATNFNGRTNLVRADSIYAFDFTLRQTGLLQVGGTNPGMDFPRENNFDAATRGTGGFGGTGNPNDRMVFTARPDANIDVFDTYFYGQVSTIPIRDAITGPIRVATNGSGQRILIGVTANGIVIVRLPTIVNVFPAPRPLLGATGPR